MLKGNGERNKYLQFPNIWVLFSGEILSDGGNKDLPSSINVMFLSNKTTMLALFVPQSTKPHFSPDLWKKV